jgi:hypothetical protein
MAAILFDTHGLGTVQQHNDWSNELLERIARALEVPDGPEEGQEDKYPLE